MLFTALFILFVLPPIPAQTQCSTQCPPINDAGKYIPSLCPFDTVSTVQATHVYPICHPILPSLVSKNPSYVNLEEFRKPGHITVIANYYTGCEAGRRESGVFAHVAQRWHDEYFKTGYNVNFIVSLKGEGNCAYWSERFQKDALTLYPESDIVPTTMPLTIDDDASQLLDYYFTSPYPHPSYVILDENLTVRNKFVGPCCGYDSYSECEKYTARQLDTTLSNHLQGILDEYDETAVVQPELPLSGIPTSSPPSNYLQSFEPTNSAKLDCQVGEFSDWSPCSATCGSNGIRFRWRTVASSSTEEVTTCPSPIETRSCVKEPCEAQCVPEFGIDPAVRIVQDNLASPRDVAFHPSPGLHLGNYSEGRSFPSDPNGEEAWIVNGNNHSVSIIVNSHDPSTQTSISRRDRGYYHYMINATALAFNTVAKSGRSDSQDTFNYWAVCNNNRNTYLDTKEPNYFMGPTLYNSDPNDSNLVNRAGKKCSVNGNEPCYFLHADMLHESPACIGIAHDPELRTGYGSVYWAFDSTGDRLTGGQLVRFDFRQPHGPGSMDHSTAAVRRFPEIKLQKGAGKHVHAGMVVHPTKRELYVVSPEEGVIWAVGTDTGKYSRTAREEYPIFSNKLPSFEYSIYECVNRRILLSNLNNPSGLALSADGLRLFVAESNSGKIKSFEIDSGALLGEIETGYFHIKGIAISPRTNRVHFVDSQQNVLASVEPKPSTETCQESNKVVSTRVSQTFVKFRENARDVLDGINGEGFFALDKHYVCKVNPNIPNSTLFEQVHVGTGYASNDTNVQSEAGMDANAALLANRTDCSATSDLNFDALLLGGYYCHTCLPQNEGSSCDSGGKCTNLPWRGFSCDNEFLVSIEKKNANNNLVVVRDSNGIKMNDSRGASLARGVTYRFTINSTDVPVTLFEDKDLTIPWSTVPGNPLGSALNGPLIFPVDESTPRNLYLSSSINAGNFFKLFVNTSSSFPTPAPSFEATNVSISGYDGVYITTMQDISQPRRNGKRWKPMVSITLDSNGITTNKLVQNIAIEGTFLTSADNIRTRRCTTDANGQCVLKCSTVKSTVDRVVLAMVNLFKTGVGYDPDYDLVSSITTFNPNDEPSN